MAMLSSTIDMAAVNRADELLRAIGCSPVFGQAVEQLDFDPDAFLDSIEQMKQMQAELAAARSTLDQPFEGWNSVAAASMQQYRDCVRTWFDDVIDFLLSSIEDYLAFMAGWMQSVRWLCDWIFWACGWLGAIVAAATLVAAGPAGLMAAIAAVGEAVGVVAASLLALAALAWVIELLSKKLYNLIDHVRNSLCGGSKYCPLEPTGPYDNDWRSPPTWPFG